MLSSAESWKRTGSQVKRMLALATFSEIAKAFYKEETAPNLKSLCSTLDIPKIVASACIMVLVEKDLVCEIEDENGEPRFKPAYAPDSITLARFFQILGENAGDSIVSSDIAKRSRAASFATEAFASLAKSENMQKTIKDLVV